MAEQNESKLFFGGKAVDEKRKIDIATLRTLPFGILLQRGYLIFEDHLCFVKHPPNQRTLAVIHTATSNESQQIQIGLGIDVLLDPGFEFRGRQYSFAH